MDLLQLSNKAMTERGSAWQRSNFGGYKVTTKILTASRRGKRKADTV
jgi:hypothetical protein